MKKRNIIAFLLLCIITFGIYQLYWMYKTRLALVEKNGKKDSIPPLSHIFLPLLAVVLVAFVQLVANSSESGAPIALNILTAILGICGIIFAVVMSFVFMYRFSLASADVMNTNDGTSLFWLWVLGSFLFSAPIGPVAIQLHMNQYVDKANEPVSTNPLSQPPTAPTV